MQKLKFGVGVAVGVDVEARHSELSSSQLAPLHEALRQTLRQVCSTLLRL
jgi:hypothetical protein